ncbi:MAG: hypothetical protein ACPL4K_00730 [Candidatus Margulisiibacteriota bacterium]
MWRFKDYKGTPIILTDQCWEEHILFRHPEVKKFLGKMQKVLEAPDVWRESDKDENVVLYYKSGIIKGKYGELFLVVVVRYEKDKKHGYVATAYLTKKPKGGYTK